MFGIWSGAFVHVIIAVAELIEPLLVMAGSRLVAALKQNQRIGLWMDRSHGALFVGLGIRLATSERG